ncbi:MAG: small conductance mechanosensitive channel [Chlamydiales bacterium]|jgi:small conductance mechanosensitive channel
MNEYFCTLWQHHFDDILDLFHNIGLIILILFLIRVFIKILKKATKHLSSRYPDIDLMSIQMLSKTITYAIFTVGCIIILDLLGVNTTSIITILGTAGITIGLAMKDTLSNIASGFMLLILRPFKIEDSIECGGILGTVKEIGLFSCILRDSENLYISVPNRALWDKPLKNHSRK